MQIFTGFRFTKCFIAYLMSLAKLKVLLYDIRDHVQMAKNK